MGSPSDRLAEAVPLIELLCNAQIKPESFARLEKLVLADRAVRQTYIRYLHLHTSLPQFARQDLATGSLPLAQPMASTVIYRRRGTAKSGLAKLKEIKIGPFSIGTVAMLVGLFLFLVITLVVPALRSEHGPANDVAVIDNPPADATKPEAIKPPANIKSPGKLPALLDAYARAIPNPTPIATARAVGDSVAWLYVHGLPQAEVIQLAKCRWVGPPLTVGEPLAKGRRLELKAGLAEIRFLSGARAIMQGPSILEVRSATSAVLSEGRLCARMTKHLPKGFVIHTPRADVVDLGTEFGVQVDGKQNAVVQVFSGVVEMGPAPAPKIAVPKKDLVEEKPVVRPVRITQGEAMQFDSESGTTALVDFDKIPQFVKKMPPAEGIVTEGLIEHLSASEGVTSDPQTHCVSRWANLAERGGDAVEQDPSRVMPTLVPEGPAGRPALWFNGLGYLESKKDDAFRFPRGVTWLVVLQPDDPPGTAADHNFIFGTLNNSPGDWLGITAGLTAQRSPYAFYRPARLDPFDPSQYVRSPRPITGLHVISSRLDPASGTGSLRIDGSEVASQPGTFQGTQFDGGPLVVGRGRGGDPVEVYCGYISELLIYDRPLADEEWAAGEKDLLCKYKVKSAEVKTKN